MATHTRSRSLRPEKSPLDRQFRKRDVFAVLAIPLILVVPLLFVRLDISGTSIAVIDAV
ncbi:hypothetical protein N24_0914 [Corynebacterium suranareeae]|uniref:Uncharacterized protein n=1 Tax=Corynebacterium suranareeae TaxID=2506452 RepID=A0A160PP19_9CORY|nr:hypothetical protein [Corynebacterium suranareeae]BAU95176.1 hypothetical protein N24_0914 [Corynebacterium suranareeae]